MVDTRPVLTREYHSGSMIEMPVALAELGIDGLRAPSLPVTLPARCRTDLLTVDGRSVAVRIVGDRHDAEWGGFANLELCGSALRLSAGDHVLRRRRERAPRSISTASCSRPTAGERRRRPRTGV